MFPQGVAFLFSEGTPAASPVALLSMFLSVSTYLAFADGATIPFSERQSAEGVIVRFWRQLENLRDVEKKKLKAHAKQNASIPKGRRASARRLCKSEMLVAQPGGISFVGRRSRMGQENDIWQLSLKNRIDWIPPLHPLLKRQVLSVTLEKCHFCQ